MASVTSFSSQYIHESFHATQVVGPYDLYPAYGDTPNARGQGALLDTHMSLLGHIYSGTEATYIYIVLGHMYSGTEDTCIEWHGGQMCSGTEDTHVDNMLW